MSEVVNRNRIFVQSLQPFMCVALSVLFLFAGVVDAAREDGDNGRSRKEERLEQMRQEARPYADGIGKALTALLNPTAKNQRPEQAITEGAQSALDQSKRYLSVFEERQKAEFMLLQAWTSFYQGDLPKALSWSMRACKTNEASQDAWNSQALFCMLSDKRPLMPRIEVPKKRPERPDRPDRPSSRRRRNEDYTSYTESVKPYSESGTLDFDLFAVRGELLREQFTRQKCVSVGGELIEYVPQKNTLCILFWQVDEGPSDAEGTGDGPGQMQDAVDFIGMEVSHAIESQKTSLQTQRDYITKLKKACVKNPEIQFLQVNTDQTETAAQAAVEAAKDPSVEQAGPLVFAADPVSNAQRFEGIKAEKPFLTVVDKEGKVKYAGTANGFMPAFILTELTGVEIDLEKIEKDGMDSGSALMTDPMMEDMMMMVDSTITKMDPNKPIADPNLAADILSRPGQIPNYPLPNPKPAAPLASLEWIKGTPVRFEHGRVYVVEFWDTLATPCIESIPYLTQVQKKYKDKGVTVIGITSESKILGLQDSDDVKKFVAEQGSKMDYTVAVDKEKKAFATYMQAYNQAFIPIAFVVDKAGLVVWYGDPNEALDMVLEKEVARNFDTGIRLNNQADPNAVIPAKPIRSAQQKSDFPPQSLEDQVRAENKLREAQLHIEQSRKIRMDNPKEGIAAAREVLAEYPNTEYAERARELLRRVPDRWKKRHNITDEELGY